MTPAKRTDSDPGYQQERYSPVPPTLRVCYLCHADLRDPMSIDQVIAEAVFDRGSGSRPALWVHEDCGRRKSADDAWFKRAVDVMRSAAGGAAPAFTADVPAQSRNAFLTDASLRRYKLARTALRPAVPGAGAGTEDPARLTAHAAKVCEGLYLRNVPGAIPAVPRVDPVQYARAGLAGDGRDIVGAAMELTGRSRNTRTLFRQQWSPRVQYLGGWVPGRPDAGFVLLEFHGAVAFLAVFVPNPPPPASTAAADRVDISTEV